MNDKLHYISLILWVFIIIYGLMGCIIQRTYVTNIYGSSNTIVVQAQPLRSYDGTLDMGVIP